MTVTYNYHISNTGSLRVLCLIFSRWRGSVWQCILRELIIWLVLYGGISAIYRHVLDSEQTLTFENLVLFCYKHTSSIPITFLLGFYVSLIMKRWWETYCTLPWVDTLALRIVSFMHCPDKRSKSMRQTIARQLVLMFVLTFRDISLPVHKRFPTIEHVVDAGLMTVEERKLYESLDNSLGWSKFWLPTTWISKLFRKAHKEGYILSERYLENLLDELVKYRLGLGSIMDLDWINIPLVYTQVAHLSVRFYFFVCLIGQQFLDPAKEYPGHEIDMYFPLFTTVQFIIFMGWIKVAEVAINPWGEDDDDFEINYMIDRHLQVLNGFLDNSDNGPEGCDKSEKVINEIPYTQASAGLMDGRKQSVAGSVAHVPVGRKASTFITLNRSTNSLSSRRSTRSRKASRPIDMAVELLKQRMGRNAMFLSPDSAAGCHPTIPTIVVDQHDEKSNTETAPDADTNSFQMSKLSDVIEESEPETEE